MMAVRTTAKADSVSPPTLRNLIEQAVPHGGPSVPGSWKVSSRLRPGNVDMIWDHYLDEQWNQIIAKHPKIARVTVEQLGPIEPEAVP
jgi:hypothetical protein